MANIAQTINVLQAMILTDKEKMILTPTYRVFEMFKVHQGGTFLPVDVQSPDYVFGQREDPGGQRLGHEGGRRQGGAPLARQHAPDTAPCTVTRVAGGHLAGVGHRPGADRAGDERAQHVRGARRVKPVAFDGVKLAGGTLTLTLPAKSVVDRGAEVAGRGPPGG